MLVREGKTMKLIAITNRLDQIIGIVERKVFGIKPYWESLLDWNEDEFRVHQNYLTKQFNKQQELQEHLKIGMKDICQICNDGVTEATEQLANESGLYVCYHCKIFQKDVTP